MLAYMPLAVYDKSTYNKFIIIEGEPSCHRRRARCRGEDDDEVANRDDVDDGTADGGFGGGVDGRVSCGDGFGDG